MRRRALEILLLAGFLVLAVLLHRSTASYPKFVQGSTAAYVRFLAISLGGLCVLDLLLSLRRRRLETGEGDAARPDARRFWMLLALLGLYAAALGPFGFFPASAAFLPAAMYATGARRPLPVLLTTLGILAFVHLVFVQLLAVHLPMGTLY